MSRPSFVAEKITDALVKLTRDSGCKQTIFTIAQISAESGLSRSAVTARLYPAGVAARPDLIPREPIPGVFTATAESGAKGASLRVMPQSPLQELYNKFDGVEPSGNSRLAWYGQCRAEGMPHDEAIQATYEQYKSWCNEFWPKRGIELPTTSQGD